MLLSFEERFVYRDYFNCYPIIYRQFLRVLRGLHLHRYNQVVTYIEYMECMRFNTRDMAIVFHTRAAPRIGQSSSKGMC
jgi:hypothetical protein